MKLLHHVPTDVNACEFKYLPALFLSLSLSLSLSVAWRTSARSPAYEMGLVNNVGKFTCQPGRLFRDAIPKGIGKCLQSNAETPTKGTLKWDTSLIVTI